jgi:hypothetical protein
VADNSSQNPSPEDQEKAFWEKMTGTIDSWWDNKMKAYENSRANSTSSSSTSSDAGTSRTGGKRVTLPGLIADLVFGPQKD